MIKIKEPILTPEEKLLLDIKEFIADDSDDLQTLMLIRTLKSAAEEFIKGLGVNSSSINYENSLYKLAVMMLISHWYENRNIVAVGTITKEMEISFKSIVIQLRNIKSTV